MQHVMGYVNHPAAVLGDVLVLTVIWHLIIFAVPAFVLISGMALFHNYGSVQDFNYREYLRKRVVQILIPYLLWSLFYYFFNGLTAQGSFLYYVLTGRASYHLWYIVVIFQLYLLFPILCKYLLQLRTKLRSSWELLGVMTGLLALHLFLNWFYIAVLHLVPDEEVKSSLFAAFLEYSYLFFVLWQFYFVLGGLGVFYGVKMKEWLPRVLPYNLAVWLGILFYLLITYGNSMSWLGPRLLINVNTLSLYKPVVAVFALSTLLNLYPLCHWLAGHQGNLFSRLLKTVSSYSFSIYLAHPLVIHLLTKKVYNFPDFSPTIKFFLTVSYTLIIITYCTYLSKRILYYAKCLAALIKEGLNRYFLPNLMKEGKGEQL